VPLSSFYCKRSQSSTGNTGFTLMPALVLGFSLDTLSFFESSTFFLYIFAECRIIKKEVNHRYISRGEKERGMRDGRGEG
jgi:hypothetical protein